MIAGALHLDGEMSAAAVLEAPTDDLISIVHRSAQDNPCLRTTTRIRRPAPVVAERIDRLAAPADTLADHLTRQLRLTRHDARTVDLAQWIIGNLDAHGYLRQPLSELAAPVGESEAAMERALALVQSLEPEGVGAQSLRECLLLQLRAQPQADAVAVELVDHHLKAVAERRVADLARLVGCSADRIEQALAAIRRLEPLPGRAFCDPTPITIRPEAAIERVGAEYRVVLADDDLPEVRVCPRRWAEAASSPSGGRTSLAHGLRGASWLVTALERRRRTLRGVVTSIVRRQHPFLDHGPAWLRPLSLGQVANDVGVHESTVSRAVAHRYVDTPHGIFR